MGHFAPKVEVNCIVDTEKLKEQIVLNNGRGIPDIVTIKPKVQETQRRPCAIIGAGPSLEQTWTEIPDGSVIISCGRSYKFLLEKGIDPDYVVTTDRSEAPAELLTPVSDTIFLVDSACNEKTFDVIGDRESYIFNSVFKEFDAFEHMKDNVGGGPHTFVNVGLCVVHACTHLAYIFGHRDSHIFGFDSMNGYVEGVLGDTDKELYKITMGKYEVITPKEFFIYAVWMGKFLKKLNERGFNHRFYGENLTELIDQEVAAGRYTAPEVV